MKKFLSLLLLLSLLISLVPTASAAGVDYDTHLDLSSLIENKSRRDYVEMMLSYHLRTNERIQKTLEEGNSAVFFFEGCSDNMDHPDLSMIDYYRVSAVCLVVKLNEKGQPHVVFFNQNCSTIPDRPLEYGAWYVDKVGSVGPATVFDGTYDLYSVYHGNAYEALQVRTDSEDWTVRAVYMIREGFVTSQATGINIHTRNVNHTITKSMWSAGCILVGDGNFAQFRELMASTYYSKYGKFKVEQPVGTVTIDRHNLKQKLYDLYEFTDAVDKLLEDTTKIQPEAYLLRCTQEESYEEYRTMRTLQATDLMSLPCSNRSDARSVLRKVLPKGEKLQVTASYRNPLGNLWYQVQYGNQIGYIYSADAQLSTPVRWFGEVWNTLFE